MEVDTRQLKSYLLGELPENEAEALEEAFFADDELFAILQSVEDDLVDAYVDQELDGHQRARFEARFLITPDGRRKVAFARALRAKLTEAPARTATPDRTFWQALREWLWPASPMGRFATVAITAALLLVVGLYVAPPSATTVYPSELRGSGEVTTVEIPHRGSLRLRLVTEQPAATAVVRIDDETLWEGPVTPREGEARLSIPAHVLLRGSIEIELRTETGAATAYYDLRLE